jgi:hypothetical protein
MPRAAAISNQPYAIRMNSGKLRCMLTVFAGLTAGRTSMCRKTRPGCLAPPRWRAPFASRSARAEPDGLGGCPAEQVSCEARLGLEEAGWTVCHPAGGCRFFLVAVAGRPPARSLKGLPNSRMLVMSKPHISGSTACARKPVPPQTKR